MSLRDKIISLPLPQEVELCESVFGYTEIEMEKFRSKVVDLVRQSGLDASSSPCVVCGEAEPRTGTCGSTESRALCNLPPVTDTRDETCITAVEVGRLSVFEDAESTFGFGYDISTNYEGHRRLQKLDGATLYVAGAAGDEMRFALQALLDNPAPGPMMRAEAFDAALEAHIAAKELARAALAGADARKIIQG